MKKFRSVALAASLAGLCGAAHADELKIGIDYEPSIDPQFLYTVNNIAVSRHIFDALVHVDENQALIPGLATKWERVDQLTWEFTLREGVSFHDGSAFDAADVIYTAGRVNSIENNPNPYAPATRSIESFEAEGNILRITTQYPDPTLPDSLTDLYIVPSELGDVSPDDFRSGAATIGTGPYSFVSYTPSETLKLEKNPGYWGEVEPWDTVSMKIIPDNSARLIALMSGEVDAITNIDPANTKTVRENDALQVAAGPSTRIIYLILDTLRSQTPQISAKDGSPLDANPLQDVRVREAISRAIHRDAMVERIMDGLAAPAYVLAPEFLTGAGDRVAGTEYDPAGAKELLAAAGYPDGFKITINGPNNRYLNDARVLQTVGQMLARIGLEVEVISEPFNVYFSKIRVRPEFEGMEYSLMLMGWGHGGDTGNFMGTVLHSYDPDKGFGSGNRSGYSDPALDTMLQDAMAADVGDTRAALLDKAMTAVAETYSTIPLYIPFTVIAGKADLDITVRGDEALLAMEIRPAE